MSIDCEPRPCPLIHLIVLHLILNFKLSLNSPIISERGKTAKTGDSEKMDAEAAFWEERGEGAAATLGKFANDWGID